MITIWKKNSNWIPQGDRSVSCFDSGLVRLQQTFIAPVGTPPSANYDVGDPFPGVTTPCIDGAYIYPAPSYSDTGNGFTSATVSAYGRWKTSPYVTREKVQIDGYVGMPVKDILYRVMKPSTTGGPGGFEEVYKSATLPQNLEEGWIYDTQIVTYNISNINSMPQNFYDFYMTLFTDKIITKFVSAKNSNLNFAPDNSLLKFYTISGQIIPNPCTPLQFQSVLGGSIEISYKFQDANSGSTEQSFSRTYKTISLSASQYSGTQTASQSILNLRLSQCTSTDFGYWEEFTLVHEPETSTGLFSSTQAAIFNFSEVQKI